MQISLFDDDHRLRMEYVNALSLFELERARQILGQLNSKMEGPPDIAQKRQALDTLIDNHINIDDPPIASLARLIRSGKLESELGALQPDYFAIRKGAYYKLSQILPECNGDFLYLDLHPAEVYIETEQYKRALDFSEYYLNKKNEHPLVRQLQGYTFWKQNNDKAASISITYALFNNPLQCKPQYLCPKSVQDKFDAILMRATDLRKTMIFLPFELWKAGLAYITPQSYFFADILETLLESNKEKIKNDALLNRMYFNWLLYLAEMERLREGRQNLSRRLIQLRKEMQEVNDELYGAYLSVLESFRNL